MCNPSTSTDLEGAQYQVRAVRDHADVLESYDELVDAQEAVERLSTVYDVEIFDAVYERVLPRA